MARIERHKRQRPLRKIIEYLRCAYGNDFVEAFIPYEITMGERLSNHASDDLRRMGLQVTTERDGITIFNPPHIIG